MKFHDRRAGGAPQWSRWRPILRTGGEDLNGKPSTSSKRQREEETQKNEPKKTWKKIQKPGTSAST